jgi:hypothetical protein
VVQTDQETSADLLVSEWSASLATTGIKVGTHDTAVNLGSAATTDLYGGTVAVENSGHMDAQTVTLSLGTNTWLEFAGGAPFPLSLVCGAECQIHNTGSGAAVDSHWSGAISTGSAPAVVSSPVRSGSYAYSFDSGAAGDESFLRHQLTPGGSNLEGTYWYYRLYFRLPSVTAPSALISIATTRDQGTNDGVSVVFDTDGDIKLSLMAGAQNGTKQATTPDSSTNNFTPSADTWYGVEVEAYHADNDMRAKWRTWSESGGWTTSESISSTDGNASTGNIMSFEVGLVATSIATANFVVIVDDIVAGKSGGGSFYDDTSTNGVSGKVLRLDPTSDGTHSFDAGDFEYISGGTHTVDVSTSATDVWSYLDEADMEQTSAGIQQESSADTGDYVEVNFGDESTEDDPRGVQVVSVNDSNGTEGLTTIIDVSDDGTTWVDGPALSNGAAGFTTTVLAQSPSGSAWTRTLVNSTRARIYGPGSGWNTQHYALALEVEWTAEATGTTETQSVSGSITPAGAPVSQAQQELAGAITPAGSPAIQAASSMAGSSAPAGSVAHRVVATQAGAITPAGTVVTSSERALAAAGAITPDGSIDRQVQAALAGAMAPAGSPAHRVAQLAAGSIATAGQLGSRPAISAAGVLAAAGVHSAQRRAAYSGSTAPSGAARAQPQQQLAGSVAPSGSASAAAAASMAGAISPAGAIAQEPQQQLAGSVAPSGSAAAAISHAISGTISPAGVAAARVSHTIAGAIAGAGAAIWRALQQLAGSITPAGNVDNIEPGTLETQDLAGSIAPTGSHAPGPQQLLAGVVAPTGDVAPDVAQQLAGSITPAGTHTPLSDQQVTLAGSITPAGAAIRATQAAYAGAIAPAAAISWRVAIAAAGSITPAGAAASVKVAVVELDGTAAMAGALAQQAAHQLAGASTAAGTVVQRARQTAAGSITPAGSIISARAAFVTAAGALLPSAALVRRAAQRLAGAIAPNGTDGLLRLADTQPAGAGATIQAARSIAARVATATIGGSVARLLSGGAHGSTDTSAARGRTSTTGTDSEAG